MSWGVGCRRGSDLAWLWLWHRSTAVAPVRLLAWEPPYAAGVALKKTKGKKKKKKVLIHRNAFATTSSFSEYFLQQHLFISHNTLVKYLLYKAGLGTSFSVKGQIVNILGFAGQGAKLSNHFLERSESFLHLKI